MVNAGSVSFVTDGDVPSGCAITTVTHDCEVHLLLKVRLTDFYASSLLPLFLSPLLSTSISPIFLSLSSSPSAFLISPFSVLCSLFSLSFPPSAPLFLFLSLLFYVSIAYCQFPLKLKYFPVVIFLFMLVGCWLVHCCYEGADWLIIVQGIINIEKEVQQLSSKITDLERKAMKIQESMSNADYETKVPAKVKSENQQKVWSLCVTIASSDMRNPSNSLLQWTFNSSHTDWFYSVMWTDFNIIITFIIIIIILFVFIIILFYWLIFLHVINHNVTVCCSVAFKWRLMIWGTVDGNLWLPLMIGVSRSEGLCCYYSAIVFWCNTGTYSNPNYTESYIKILQH